MPTPAFHALPVFGLVAEARDGRSDGLAAVRLASGIEAELDLPPGLDVDSTEETTMKLMATRGISGSIEETLGAEESEGSSDFYV